MIAFEFEYHKPKNLEEALDILSNDGYIPILGGTDVVVKMRARKLKPKGVVDLKFIEELHRFDFSKDRGMVIGAAITMNELIEDHPEVRENYPVLYQAIKKVGAYQTRNRATIAGNIGNSSPAADSVPPLLTYNAELKLVSKDGERIVKLKDFFTGPGQNILKSGEIIHSIIVPYEGPSIGMYYKLSRIKAVDLSTIGVALTVIDPDGERDIRIALASVAPKPLRVFEAEDFIRGKELTEEVVEEFAKMVQKSTSPITDARGTKEYRYEMAYVLPKKILRELGLFKEVS